MGRRPSVYRGGSRATYNETRLSAQENEIRLLNGRLEQIEYSLHKIEETVQRLQSDVDTRLSHLEEKASVATPPPSAVPVVPAQQPPSDQGQDAPAVDSKGTLGSLRFQGGKLTGGENKPKSPPLPEVPADYGLTPQEQYERAFNFLREANYSEAEDAFKAFIEKNSQDKLIDNAKYWYGETLYVRGHMEDAAVAFADAYQQNPKGTKAPDSLLKLGISLAALGKKADACVTFNELKSKYPKAAPTIRSRADDERAKLKCPAR